jgi:hypothetical protein
LTIRVREDEQISDARFHPGAASMGRAAVIDSKHLQSVVSREIGGWCQEDRTLIIDDNDSQGLG